MYSRHVRIKFDPLWYEDFSETKIIDYRVDEIKPLILNPGRLLLTERCIYFQPYNNIRPVSILLICSILLIIKFLFVFLLYAFIMPVPSDEDSFR